MSHLATHDGCTCASSPVQQFDRTIPNHLFHSLALHISAEYSVIRASKCTTFLCVLWKLSPTIQ